LELLVGERLAQRGAVPVDEVEASVSGSPVDRPGDRERNGAAADRCGDPLVEEHGRGHCGAQHRSTTSHVLRGVAVDRSDRVPPGTGAEGRWAAEHHTSRPADTEPRSRHATGEPELRGTTRE
jgi:hypothetical protein